MIKSRNDEDNQSLDYGDRSPAQSSADHNFQARNRSDKRFFQKTELFVPNYFNAGKHGGKKNAHGYYARRQKLDIISSARFLINGPEAETQGEQQ